MQTAVDSLESVGLPCFVASEVFILHLPKLLPHGSLLLLAQSVIGNKSVFVISMCYPEKGSNVTNQYCGPFLQFMHVPMMSGGVMWEGMSLSIL